MKKKCIIVGSSGFLGKKLAKLFQENNWGVIKFSSKSKQSSNYFNLKNPENLNTNLFEDCDLLINASYYFNNKNLEESLAINLEGTKKLYEAAKNANIKKIINISTLSSFNNAISIYGKTKYSIEQMGKSFNVINLRPGLFFGDESSTFDNLKKISKNLPIIPIIGNGLYKLHFTHYEDLFNLILKISNKDILIEKSETIFCCTSEFLYFKDLIKRFSGKILIPIPLSLIIFFLNIIQKTGLKLRFNIDNLYGLINYNQELNNLESFNYSSDFRMPQL